RRFDHRGCPHAQDRSLHRVRGAGSTLNSGYAAPRPVSAVFRWHPYITGITDAEREKMRAERLARGEPYDSDLWDDDAEPDAEPDLVDAARDQDPDVTLAADPAAGLNSHSAVDRSGP
ncbi:hypothetical protein, partial [Nonomuraea sp. NPDC005650]|uniref:hypothetical protein n=1 Tax=Nonomuraea sp. NPDC005650 TaxID=3157045 RepID=UPI0033A26752